MGRMRDAIRAGFIVDQELKAMKAKEEQDKPFMFAKDTKKKPRDQRQQSLDLIWDSNEDIQ